MKPKKVLSMLVASSMALSMLAVPAYATDGLKNLSGADPSIKINSSSKLPSSKFDPLIGYVPDTGYTLDVDVPALPGGDDTTIKVDFTSTEDGEKGEAKDVIVTDSDGNSYTVNYESNDVDGGDSSSEGTSKSEDGLYNAAWGESTTITTNEDASDAILDLITDGKSNGQVTEIIEGNEEVTEPTNPDSNLKENDSANYDQTTTATTDRIVSGTASEIDVTQNYKETEEDENGNTVVTSYKFFNAADIDMAWKDNYNVGTVYFKTSNYPDITQDANVYMIMAQKETQTFNGDGELVSTTSEVIPCLYCVDMSTVCTTGPEYRMINIEDAVAEGYYTEDQVKHLKAIVSLGYDWGYDEFDDSELNIRYKDDPYAESAKGEVVNGTAQSLGTADLERFKEVLRTAVVQGDIYSKDLEQLNATIENLTREQAATITQMAIWIYGNRVNGTVEFGTGSEPLNSLAFWLASQELNEDSSTDIISEDKFVDDVQLIVGSMVHDHANNQDDNSNNDVYDTSLKFSLVVTPDADKDDLTVKVVDSNGNTIRTGRIAGTAQDGEDVLEADENGYYTFSNLQLQENSETTFNLTIEGTQFLEEGVYVFQSIEDGKSSQNMIGKYTGDVDVSVSAEVSLTFNVEESTVIEHREWRRESTEKKPTPETPNTPDKPSKPDKPKPPVEPENPTPPEVPETPETPEVPTTPETVVVPEEPKAPEVIYDDVPKTGDNFNINLWVSMLVGSLGGLILLNRKKKEEEI